MLLCCIKGGIFPNVDADVNAASVVDPDHLFCYGFFKHIIQQGVASVQTLELRGELTAMVQSIVFPSGTTTLYRQWSAAGSSKFGKGTLSMRGYEQLFMALIMCAERYFQKDLYVHMVNQWKFYEVRGGRVLMTRCARQQRLIARRLWLRASDVRGMFQTATHSSA